MCMTQEQIEIRNLEEMIFKKICNSGVTMGQSRLIAEEIMEKLLTSNVVKPEFKMEEK